MTSAEALSGKDAPKLACMLALSNDCIGVEAYEIYSGCFNKEEPAGVFQLIG